MSHSIDQNLLRTQTCAFHFPFQNLEKVHFFVSDFIVEFVPNFKNLKEKEEFAYKAIFSTGKSNEIFHPPTV